jgi:hypothetical protein
MMRDVIVWQRWWWLVMRDVIVWRKWWWLVMRDVIVWRRWWRRVDVGLMLSLVERRFLPLFLLAKDVDCVL